MPFCIECGRRLVAHDRGNKQGFWRCEPCDLQWPEGTGTVEVSPHNATLKRIGDVLGEVIGTDPDLRDPEALAQVAADRIEDLRADLKTERKKLRQRRANWLVSEPIEDGGQLVSLVMTPFGAKTIDEVCQAFQVLDDIDPDRNILRLVECTNARVALAAAREMIRTEVEVFGASQPHTSIVDIARKFVRLAGGWWPEDGVDGEEQPDDGAGQNVPRD